MSDAERILAWMLDRLRRSGRKNDDDAPAGVLMRELELNRAQIEAAASILETRDDVKVNGFLGDDEDGAPNFDLVLTDRAKGRW